MTLGAVLVIAGFVGTFGAAGAYLGWLEATPYERMVGRVWTYFVLVLLPMFAGITAWAALQ